MNTGDKILGKHIRQFLHKICVTRKFDVLVLQNSVVIVQNNGKEKQKACCTCKFVFFFFWLIRKKNCAARAICFFAKHIY